MISVAMVTKPQGILGEIKVNCLLDDPAMLKGITEVFIGNIPFTVERIRCGTNEAYFKLKGIDDRNAAELLRGKTIEVCKEQEPILPKGRYYIADLLTSSVITDDGKTIGKLTEVLQYGSADVYVLVNAEGKTISFPALKRVILTFDIAGKQIIVKNAEFAEVAVYED